MLYALAMHREAQRPESARRRIPVPGLPNPESQLGVPLLVRGELVGVLCVESDVPYRFHEEDRASIELLGSYLAIAIQNMLLQERADSREPANRDPSTGSGSPRASSRGDLVRCVDGILDPAL
jgi:GAF domain-containing protein